MGRFLEYPDAEYMRGKTFEIFSALRCHGSQLVAQRERIRQLAVDYYHQIARTRLSPQEQQRFAARGLPPHEELSRCVAGNVTLPLPQGTTDRLHMTVVELVYSLRHHYRLQATLSALDRVAEQLAEVHERLEWWHSIRPLLRRDETVAEVDTRVKR
jgi:hypothetical protein